MKIAGWFIASAAALVAAIVCLAVSWHGSAAVNVAMPLSSTAVELTGGAHGPLAFAAILLLLLTVVLFLIAVIRTLISAR